MSDTIFAPATGIGQAAITIIRLSGPATRAVLATLTGKNLPTPRRATLRALRHPADGSPLDRAIILWLPGPATYTGEDCAEFHLHGGRAVLNDVADALVMLGARPAEAGEFTRRAFLNGRMDLLEAEAIGDLVASETTAQRRQALRQLEGALGAIYNDWASRLRNLMAQQEALIDFSDEDLPTETAAAAIADLQALHTNITAHLDDNRRGERLREGLIFAVAGPPNVGKSSLVNALADRDVAIVSPTPGTTRDAIETRIVLAGVPVTLVDTAGLRESADPIEAEGVRRARAHAAAADLVIAVTEPGGALDPGPGLHITNKTDLGGIVPETAIGVSALTGAGMTGLRHRLAEAARALTETTGPPPLTHARHRAALQETAARLAT
ncbi:MAG TPA: tRNA uridine-5-carboxymethylaminomethyl(34) synthesis GTPase MnmE, partial [Acetobacteraceae bacterium]|nr:tRNA uridine-5-carboxymethylaminomethyl(34) synthesis GTPase MnmE [Acetobacteraceae bacterium]